MVIAKLKSLFAADSGDDASAQHSVHHAVAALLIHAAHVDGEIVPEELAVRDRLLKEKFHLADNEIAELIAEAEQAEAESVDFYRFTRTIKDTYDRDTRMHVLEMLWELVLADGVIDDHEAHMVWRVSGLLGFTTRENGDARRAVQARLSQTSG